MTKRDFVHRRRRLYPPSGGSGGGGEGNNDDVADSRSSLTGSQGGHFVERRTTVRRRANNDDTNNVAGAKIRRKSTSSTSSTSYRRRTTNAASISTEITSDTCAKGKQQTTSHGSKATQQQHPTSPMENIPIRFAQAWNPSKLFLESSKIILDFLLYQQGILPCIMQEFEATAFDGTTPNADDRSTATGRSYRRQRHHHQKRRSSSSSHSILLLQARKEIFSVWNDLFGSIATTTIDHTPLFQQQELVISISFSSGGGSGSRNMDTCYLLSLQLQPPPSQEECHNSNNSNEGIRLHVVQPSPPQDRLARKLLTSILSSHSSSSENESRSKSNRGSHPPPPPSKKQHLVLQQQPHTNAMVHVWMENSSMEYLWQKNNHDENNNGILHNEEENPSARNSTLKQRQLPLKPDKAFSKKLRHAMLQQQQQQRPRRQNVQIYNVHLQLPFNNSVKNDKESPIGSSFNKTTSACSSASAATFDDNHGVWMQVGRPLKCIEP